MLALNVDNKTLLKGVINISGVDELFLLHNIFRISNKIHQPEINLNKLSIMYFFQDDFLDDFLIGTTYF